jgi:hypothetical protein
LFTHHARREVRSGSSRELALRDGSPRCGLRDGPPGCDSPPVVIAVRARRAALATQRGAADAGGDERGADQTSPPTPWVFEFGAQGVEKTVQRVLAGRCRHGAPQQRRESRPRWTSAATTPRRASSFGKRGVGHLHRRRGKFTSITRRISCSGSAVLASRLRCEMPALLMTTAMQGAETLPRVRSQPPAWQAAVRVTSPAVAN